MSKEPSWIGPSKKKKEEEERKQRALELSNRIKEVAKTQKPILDRGQRTAPKIEKPTTTSKNSRSNIITEQQKKTQQVATSRFQEEIESRRGVKDILANSQIGFTKKLKDDKTEEEENVLGGLM